MKVGTGMAHSFHQHFLTHSVHTASCQTWTEVCEGLEEHGAHIFIKKYLVPTVLDTVLGTGETAIIKETKFLPS